MRSWKIGIAVVLVAGGASMSLSWTNSVDVATIALSDSTRGVLFPALLGVAGLFVSVALAILGMLMSIDDKPIIVRAHERGSYQQILDRFDCRSRHGLYGERAAYALLAAIH